MFEMIQYIWYYNYKRKKIYIANEHIFGVFILDEFGESRQMAKTERQDYYFKTLMMKPVLRFKFVL